MTSKSFFESLELIANERSLSIEDVLVKVEIAMAVACRDDYSGDIKLDVDFEKKRIRVFEYKYVEGTYYMKYTDETGGNAAHSHGNTGSSSNMPPYLGVYVWKRIG